jgi:cytochrome c-type biogenesis protein
VGPVLGTVLLYAGMSETLMDGVSLLTFYSLGLGLPLFLTAMGLDRFLAGFRQVRAYGRIVSVTNGFLLILFGVLMYRNALSLLTSFFERHGIGAHVNVAGGGS